MRANGATVARGMSDWLSQAPDPRLVGGGQTDRDDDLRRRLARLPFEYRLVLLLRGPLAVSWETTALALGRSVHAAQCVQSRARRALVIERRPGR